MDHLHLLDGLNDTRQQSDSDLNNAPFVSEDCHLNLSPLTCSSYVQLPLESSQKEIRACITRKATGDYLSGDCFAIALMSQSVSCRTFVVMVIINNVVKDCS